MISEYLKLRKKYNKLQLEYDTLKEEVKNKCFETILEKIGEPITIKRLKEENKRLRIKLKEYKRVSSQNINKNGFSNL